MYIIELIGIVLIIITIFIHTHSYDYYDNRLKVPIYLILIIIIVGLIPFVNIVMFTVGFALYIASFSNGDIKIKIENKFIKFLIKDLNDYRRK